MPYLKNHKLGVVSLLFIIIGGYILVKQTFFVTPNLLVYFIGLVILSASEILLIINSVKSAKRDKYTGGQLKWFQENNVKIVEALLNEENTGIPKDKSIELLIAECDRMLDKTRRSEIVKKRAKPILLVAGMMSSVILYAYMFGAELPNSTDDVTSLTSTIIKLFNTLAYSMTINEDFFIFAILYMFIILFGIAFLVIMVPLILTDLLDSDWTAAEELRGILLYMEKRFNMLPESPRIPS